MRLIDADKIEWMDAGIKLLDCDGDQVGDIKNVELAVKSQVDKIPTVDAELVVHAEWGEHTICEYDAKKDEVRNLTLAHECSKCEYVSVFGKTNYCPNCGAKMDREV